MEIKHKFIGLTGTNGSGKGEAALFLAANGYSRCSLSDVIREELYARGEEPSRDNMIRTGNELRATGGPDVLARRISAKLEPPAVIDSIRNVAEVDCLRRLPGFILVAVDAPVELRYQRVLLRGRNESAGTLDEFRRKEDEERAGGRDEQQLGPVMAAADLTITNEGTLEEFHAKLRGLLT
jgi:Dephospho-CoA kinase